MRHAPDKFQLPSGPPYIALSTGALSTRPGRDHAGKSSCLTGNICFQLLCICMAFAGRLPQPGCTCGGFRCICIDIAVVEDSLAELDLYPPPCLFGMLGICKAVSTFFDCLSKSAGPSTYLALRSVIPCSSKAQALKGFPDDSTMPLQSVDATHVQILINRGWRH